MELPGGEREQVFDARSTQPAPPVVTKNQLQSRAGEYKQRALADGIPPRPAGLFPPGDAVLCALAADPRLSPFEKHLPGEASPYELLPQGGWATGDAAAARGVDLRLFYKEPDVGEQYGTIRAAVRFGDGASIGSGFYMSAHGGSIETALDEATAELAKLEFSSIVSTREATFSMLRPVPLHRTLLLTCRIKEQRGIRCYVEGTILAGEEGPSAAPAGLLAPRAAPAVAGAACGSTGGGAPVVYATCSAMLVDVKHFIQQGMG